MILSLVQCRQCSNKALNFILVREPFFLETPIMTPSLAHVALEQCNLCKEDYRGHSGSSRKTLDMITLACLYLNIESNDNARDLFYKCFNPPMQLLRCFCYQLNFSETTCSISTFLSTCANVNPYISSK